jgi:Xaa-Pro dipeptidase
MNKADLKLDTRLMAIVEAEYPRYSKAEMQRRRALVERAIADAGVDHLIVYGVGFRGGPVHWVSDWHTTWEAVLIVTPGKKDSLFIQFYNHLPLARLMMPDTDVRWGGEQTIRTVIGELEARGAKENRVGVIGPLPIGHYKAVAAKFGDVKDMNGAYFRMRMVKSQEEVDWARIAARLSDLSIEALIRDIRPGIDERELGAIVEGAYLPWGGTNVIHFFGVTPMANPQICVPRQHPSTRKVQAGDVISTEITASFWDASGQILRTFFVGAEPTPLYKQLHAFADEAFDAIVGLLRPGAQASELAEAAKLIEKAGFSFYDDITHGFGGGYLQPIIGSPTRRNDPLPPLTLAPGMMLVVQPNVITKDEKAGVQTGECFVITEHGAESIHTAPRGPFRVG